ncbi:MAG: PEGA domain-containing protein [bacterium]
MFGVVPAAFAQERTAQEDTPHERTAQEDASDTADDMLPEEQREELRLGFAQLTTEDVPAEFGYIARSLPLVLLNEFEDIPERVRTSGELRAVALTLLEDARDEVSGEIAGLVEERDELLFQSSGNGQSSGGGRESERVRINQELGEARELLEVLQGTSPERVARRLDTRMPLTTIRHSNERPLFPEDARPGGDRSDAGQSGGDRSDADGSDADGSDGAQSGEDVDLLVGGTMRYEDGYLSLDLVLLHESVTDAAGGLSTGEYRRPGGDMGPYVAREPLATTIVRPEDALDELEELQPDITSGILNRPFSRLQVDVEPPSASVSLNGSLAGFGSVSLPYLEPDRYELVVTAAGYGEQVREVELNESESAQMSVDLSPLPAERVTIRSEPEGADLYVGSEWVGRTPVTMDRPPGPRTAELSREGFRESRFVLEDRGPDSLSRVLAPDSVDLADELRDRRQGFYRSLGWLAVSLPAPLILSGIWQNRVDYFLDRQQSMSISEQERFVSTVNIIDGVRWGGVALSAGLLVNSIVQAVRYIRASRYYHVE